MSVYLPHLLLAAPPEIRDRCCCRLLVVFFPLLMFLLQCRLSVCLHVCLPGATTGLLVLLEILDLLHIRFVPARFVCVPYMCTLYLPYLSTSSCLIGSLQTRCLPVCLPPSSSRVVVFFLLLIMSAAVPSLAICSAYLPACESVCQSVCLQVPLLVCLHVCLCVCLSV